MSISVNYYNGIKNELINNEINKKVKNYSINRSYLNTYYNFLSTLFDTYFTLIITIVNGYYKIVQNITMFYYNCQFLFIFDKSIKKAC